MEVADIRVETQGDILWDHNQKPYGIMSVTIANSTLVTTPAEIIRAFELVLHHAQQIRADLEMIEAMLKVGITNDQIKAVTNLAMLKRMAGNG